MGVLKGVWGGAVVACIGVALLLAAGCGSSTAKPKTAASTSSAASTVSKPAVQTKAVYITQADALCTQYNAEGTAIAKEERRVMGQHLGVAGEAKALISIYEKYAASSRRFNARTSALQQPPGDSAILTKITAGHEAQAVGADRLANALRHFDASTWSALKREIEGEQARLHALEEGYGFKVCGVAGNPR